MNYKTQMEAAKKGIITKEMQTVAKKEYMAEEKLMELVACGRVAIPANINHKSLNPEGIGEGLKTKINVNLGVSGDSVDYEREMEKVRMSIKFGAEAIMDLSNYWRELQGVPPQNLYDERQRRSSRVAILKRLLTKTSQLKSFRA